MQSRIDDKFNLIDHPDSGVENTVADFPARTPPRANELVAGDKEVHANYFLLKLNTETPLFEYAIEDIPVGINQILHRKMFEGAIAAILPPNAHTGKYATDHLKTIIAWEELQMNPAAKHIVHESGSRRWIHGLFLPGRHMVGTYPRDPSISDLCAGSIYRIYGHFLKVRDLLGFGTLHLRSRHST
jgi:hypothetical protein